MGQSGINYLSKLPPWKGKGGFSLDKIQALMQALGDPQNEYKTIHVAGTNGKGSVSVASAAMLAANGSKVGLITSPHLNRINERVIFDGLPVSDELLDAVALQVQFAASTCGLDISFFEAITACGFLAFQSLGVDWAVVEVGLGGRLDATNILRRPEVCVVTTIDYDHQDLLGSTLEKIAIEKAGIFKAGANVVIGELKNGPRRALIDRAKQLECPTYSTPEDFSWNMRNANGEYIDYKSERFGSISIPAQFAGDHQAQNISTALTAVRSVGVSSETCLKGLATAFWPARLESISFKSNVFLLDCAHNPAGVRALGEHLKKNLVTKCTLVFGALDTKEWQEMLTSLLPFAAEVLVVEPIAPNPVPSSKIAAFLSGNGVRFRVFDYNYRALLEYVVGEPTGKTIVVAGSIYMVGKFREMLLNQDVRYWSECSTRSTIR